MILESDTENLDCVVSSAQEATRPPDAAVNKVSSKPRAVYCPLFPFIKSKIFFKSQVIDEWAPLVFQ